MEQRTWTAPKTGLMMLQKIDAERQKFLELLAIDAGVPKGADVDFTGAGFIERPCANTSQNEGDQTETEDG